jgi:aldose 1-epimerase
MRVVTIQDASSGSRAAIAVGRGFNCFLFEAVLGGQRVDVIGSQPGFETGEGQPSHNGIPILFPFPNRIREGRFTWDGKDYQLPLSPGHPNTLHGFCYDRPWRLVEQGDNFAVGQFQLSVDAIGLLEHWPSDFIIDVRYTVEGAALRMQVTVQNPTDSPLPWGFGTHAYFRLPLGSAGSKNRCLVQAPAAQEWVLEECLPTGQRRPVGPEKDLRSGVTLENRKLDDVLTGLGATGGTIQTVITDPDAGLQVVQEFSDEFRELVVFTPPWMDAVCLEPYTCVTDAINLQSTGVDAGWRELPAGKTWETEIVIRVKSLRS